MKREFLYFLFALVFIAPLTMNGQRTKLANPFENKGTIENRFDYLYKTSTNYQEYKVITRTGFVALQENVKDTISFLKNDLTANRKAISKQNVEIAQLKKELLNKNNELNLAKTGQDSIGFLGVQMSKRNYTLIILLIITGLLVTSGFFIFKFKNSLVLTKEAQQMLDETQREFEIHQKKSLERQQVLSRKLQDEINKNKKD
ncbi:tRNA (guanine-N1)-methyltransferase [Flavicella sediminum]|uniref:tRNA (guanine-N1)-methyltransferase n=1 Tax=Flavicella sediminum TaxID=2585141 RepID=UPI00111D636C|nr:tRNA (guanine-N1)-methyltransferase [Flavicella sediminum]